MFKDFNIKHIIKILSIFLIVESIFMFLAALVSLSGSGSSAFALTVSGALTLFVALVSFLLTRAEKGKVNIRESYFIFAFLWILLAIFGCFPYWLSGTFPSFIDCFFESISGFTTTGSSVLPNIDTIPPGLLFWRSSTQWLGGIFFIVFSLSLLPMLGIGGMRYQSHEPITFQSSKFHPRMEDSIIWLCVVYLALTTLEVVALKLVGMSFFDAVCHSFSTISTGGFSTKTANIAYWNSPAIELTLIIFMFLAGINFTIFFYLIKGKFKKVFRNEDLKFYSLFILIFSVIITLGLVGIAHMDVFSAVRTSLFQVVSTISTTGFYMTNVVNTIPVLYIFIFILMLLGASSGSASGGLKVSRVILILKNSLNEFKRFMHPNALSLIRYNNNLVPLQMINNAFLFLLLYIFVAVIGILFLTIMGIGFGDSVRMSLSTLGNIGYGTGIDFTTVENFASLPALGKAFLSLLMLIGRLELYAFFLLFSRSFWSK